MTKTTKVSVTKLYLLTEKNYAAWLKKQSAAVQTWLKANGFSAKAHEFQLLQNASGKVDACVYGAGAAIDMWSLGDLSRKLPKGNYEIANEADVKNPTELYLGYLLGRYQYEAYSKQGKLEATLKAPKKADTKLAQTLADSAYLARDLINMPPNDLNPPSFAKKIEAVAKQHKASVRVVSGKALEKDYPTVHMVGKASATQPVYVDVRWGDKKHKKVTLIGKGVTFDSGGLDIKPSAGMRMMKKDMGGAATALALANAIMASKLPVQLRLLIPTVENSISGNAMRPSDVIKTKKGTTVEVGNTDAEGRLILCDALYEADDEKPDLIIDFATLTGAARVALGTDIPAYFTPNNQLAAQFEKASEATQDVVWRLPLAEEYRSKLKSPIADMNNDAGSYGYGGAITAALFLEHFVANTQNWIHIDMMAWNLDARPGRPKGGEAQTLRAVYQLIKARYKG